MNYVSFPPLSGFLSLLSRVDAKKTGQWLVLAAATVAAVIVAVTLFAYKHAKRFWQEHGEDITLQFMLFVERLEEAIRLTVRLGAASRPVVNRWGARAVRWLSWALNRVADGLFYALAEGQLAN